jgi:hypothetical protein
VACTGGKECGNGGCACPSGQKDCQGTCIPANICCGTCSSPQICQGGNCCLPSGIGTCWDDFECCSGMCLTGSVCI